MEEQKYIMIKGVPNQLKSDLQNIAKNSGVTLAGLLKPKLREIAESYPQQMKIRRQD
jgi:hypothetical protein